MAMYTPAHFAESDGERVAAIIERYGFATLISAAGENVHITHAPLLLDRDRGPQGTLVGHIARTNPHATALADGDTVTALFHGPHGYVSPTWYEAPGVPTWNYAAVHVHGTVRRVDDAGAKWQIITRLSAQYETGSANPWNPELKKEQWWKMLDAIVGFEIAITAVEAKFKLSQNRPRKDQENVIARFGADAHPDSHAMAAMMRENLERKEINK
ncbi:MAG: FMN-binding negative transcriptional regulator [Betaproteobacteria bacterium]|nr:FMN-binding negative transcriptional regulator [Betaproteobacteria bacterium]